MLTVSMVSSICRIKYCRAHHSTLFGPVYGACSGYLNSIYANQYISTIRKMLLNVSFATAVGKGVRRYLLCRSLSTNDVGSGETLLCVSVTWSHGKARDVPKNNSDIGISLMSVAKE